MGLGAALAVMAVLIRQFGPASAQPGSGIALSMSAVGIMSSYYNMKNGLQGDGIHPPNPDKRIRAMRSRGTWAALPPPVIDALKPGFGRTVSDHFATLPPSVSWASDILAETSRLSDIIQDAM